MIFPPILRLQDSRLAFSTPWCKKLTIICNLYRTYCYGGLVELTIFIIFLHVWRWFLQSNNNSNSLLSFDRREVSTPWHYSSSLYRTEVFLLEEKSCVVWKLVVDFNEATLLICYTEYYEKAIFNSQLIICVALF